MELEAARANIEAALRVGGDTHNFEDVKALVDAGQMQVWTGPCSIILTEIAEHPRKRILNFFLAAGNLAEIEAMYPLIEEYARVKGCDAVMMSGRKGWLRTFLARWGWQEKLVVMSKELIHEESQAPGHDHHR